MIQKKYNWVSMLDNFILSKSGVEFSYGDFDCCLFVCDGIKAMTGVDVAAEFRGKYRSKTGAGKICKKDYGSWGKGVFGIASFVCEQVGFKSVAQSYAGRGDIVYLEPAGVGAMGLISTCGRKVVTAGRVGVTFTPKNDGMVYWRIE